MRNNELKHRMVQKLDYQYKEGYEISPDGNNPERDEFRKVILEERLRSALIKINSDILVKKSIIQLHKFSIPIFQIYLIVIVKFIHG